MGNTTMRIMRLYIATLTSVAALAGRASGFVPGSVFGAHTQATPATSFGKAQGPSRIEESQPIAIRQQRSSMASVQTMGLFGLGGPEIAIILIAGAFLLGPQKLAELGKEAGKMAGELKEVPKEFQEGLAEGEKQAQAMKKEMLADESTVEKE